MTLTKDTGRKTALVVLAGGKGTRLGSLAQPSKALTVVRQRPTIAYHLAAALEAEVNTAFIVTNDDAHFLWETAKRVRPRDTDLDLVKVQQVGHGPAAAARSGMRAAFLADHDHVTVIMADTMLDHDELVRLMKTSGTWAGVVTTPKDSKRSWCAYSSFTSAWGEGKATERELVFVGVMGVDYETGGGSAEQHGDPLEEEPMSPLLQELAVTPWPVTSWFDVGDLNALADANRRGFTSRSNHVVVLQPDGWVEKRGASDQEALAAESMRGCGVAPDTRGTQLGYATEYWPAPSLARLALYDDLPDEAWWRIYDEVHAALDRVHEEEAAYEDLHVHESRARRMLYDKVRWRQEGSDFYEHEVKVNGVRTPGILRTMNDLLEDLPLRNVPRNRIHGDPNFHNVLLDPATMTVRMLDPRGSWDEVSPAFGDPAYDQAKLMYSANGFAAVCHDLFVLKRISARDYEVRVPKLRPWPSNGHDASVMKAIQASIFLSAAPLHNERQGLALTLLGLLMARGVTAMPA